MKEFYVGMMVDDDQMTSLMVEEAIFKVIPASEHVACFDEVGDLIDYLGLDVVEMARDAMRGSR